MSVSNVNVQQSYAADGLVTQFSIPFAFFPNTAESVTKVYLVSTATGKRTLQTLGDEEDYTLPHDVDTQPSLVVFNTAPGDDLGSFDVLVIRELDLIQSIEFISSGKNLLNNIEAAVDYLTLLVQQVNENTKRAIQASILDDVSGFNLEFPPGVVNPANAGRTIVINSTATGFALGTDLAELDQALVDATTNAINAIDSATAALQSETNAANAATSAAADAAAAAESAAQAASTGFITTGPFLVTTGHTVSPAGEVTDSAVIDQVDFNVKVKGVLNSFARDEFSIFFRNAAWEKADGYERFNENSTEPGLIFTVNPTSGQITIQNNGAEDVEVTFKKINWAI